MTTGPEVVNMDRLRRYYRRQVWVYDPTRWTFLFGRGRLLRLLAAGPPPSTILEIGCGTGHNLAVLARRYPRAHLTGIDLSADMLDRAATRLAGWRDRLTLVDQPYGPGLSLDGRFDWVICSYSLSMINPGWAEVLDRAMADLTPAGRVAVVDFCDTRWALFRSWMGRNHVHLDGHLLPGLTTRFRTLQAETRRAYGGVWRYFLYIGGQRADDGGETPAGDGSAVPPAVGG